IKEELDFVYIDGNHSYDYVKKDLELYWDKVKKGGALTGDDFNIKDIARAVFEFSKEKNQDFLTYYVGGPIDVDFIFPKN
ncbi:MAG: class I SAM-dependent methyltransferase, partial [Candidatus Taylorbacteria bacterium]|nr:class I SAM-dependent methyltransferase [Candidatus Taylorbacteria bacterium]